MLCGPLGLLVWRCWSGTGLIEELTCPSRSSPAPSQPAGKCSSSALPSSVGTPAVVSSDHWQRRELSSNRRKRIRKRAGQQQKHRLSAAKFLGDRSTFLSEVWVTRNLGRVTSVRARKRPFATSVDRLRLCRRRFMACALRSPRPMRATTESFLACCWPADKAGLGKFAPRNS
jgi:hypothetical protein